MSGNNYKNILENLDIIINLKLCRDKKEARKYLKSKDINLTHTQLHELKDIYCSNTENFEALSFETLRSVAAGNMVAVIGGEVHLIRGVHFKRELQSKNIELYYDAHHGKDLPTMVTDVQLETMIIGKTEERTAHETESKAGTESQLSTSEIKGVEIHNIKTTGDLKALADIHHFDFEKAAEYFYQTSIGKSSEIFRNIRTEVASDQTLARKLPDPTFSEHSITERSQSVPLEKMHLGDLSDRLFEQNPAAHVVALDLGTVRNQAMTFISGHNLDDSARDVIHSVFERYGGHLDQILLTKLHNQLLSDNPGAAYNFFKFLADVADPQQNRTKLYPGITYGKFYNVITGQEKVTMKMIGQEIDLRETFVNFIPEYLKAKETGISLAYIQSLKVALINTYKEIFTREVNKVNRDFSSLKFNIFPVGNDVMCDEGSFVIGVCQMSPELFDLYFRACQNMTRYSEFIANKFQFDISRFKFIEDFVVLNCNPKLEQYGVDARSTREISDMQDGWFAMKLIAACDGKEGINLREDSFKYDREGSFPCSVSLREYLKNRKPDDIDSLLSNEEGFTLENILEKCPEFSALPTTYQIEVLEHWRGEQFTEEEVIKWIFNSPEIFEIAAAGSGKAGFSVAPYKTFLYRNTVEFLRNRLQYNPNREKYVIAYLRLLTHNESHITGLEFPKGVLGNVSYFELIDSLGILQKDVYKVDSVSINGLFSEDSSTIEQKILEFYLFSKPNGTVDEATIAMNYLTGDFKNKPQHKRAVEYLVLNYDQLTPEIRSLISNFALDNITDDSQRKAVENLILPLRGKGREAGSILREPPAEYNEEQLGYFRNLSSRRTEILELQLETILADDEFGKLLRVHTKEADARKLEISLEQENLRKQIASSREIDQKAIAILPSTIKEKEEAENKKLMNGFIIGTGVLGITGISVLAILKSLGVIGAAVAASAASTNSQNKNDDNKNKGKTNAA